MKSLCLLLLALLFGSVSHARDLGDSEGSTGTRGGGDLRINRNNYLSRTGPEMRKNVELFLRVLRKNRRYMLNERHVLLDDRFLADVRNMAEGGYNVVKKVGQCGYAKDGFPLTASTRIGIASDPICFDEITAKNLGVTTSHLVGLLLHEHCRHLSPFCEDDSQALIDDVIVIYDEVMNFPVNGECRVTRRDPFGEIKVESVEFRTTDLVEHGVQMQAFGRTLQLTAVRAQEGHEYKVTLRVAHTQSGSLAVPGKAIEVDAPLVISREAGRLWHRPDFLFDLSDESAGVRCRTFPAPSGEPYWRIQVPTVEVLDELFP